MSKEFKITVVALAIILDLLLLVFFRQPWPHSEMGDARYRHAERLTALQDYVQHPSSTTKATYYSEAILLHRYEVRKICLALGVLVAINSATIFCFLHYERRKTTA